MGAAVEKDVQVAEARNDGVSIDTRYATKPRTL